MLLGWFLLQHSRCDQIAWHSPLAFESGAVETNLQDNAVNETCKLLDQLIWRCATDRVCRQICVKQLGTLNTIANTPLKLISFHMLNLPNSQTQTPLPLAIYNLQMKHIIQAGISYLVLHAAGSASLQDIVASVTAPHTVMSTTAVSLDMDSARAPCKYTAAHTELMVRKQSLHSADGLCIYPHQ